jgi:leucyl aminopeptidase (aminopeptidase T)
LGLLGKAAAIAINEVIALREGEEALIATNFEGEAFPVAEAYYDAARAAGGKPVLMVMPRKDRLDRADRLYLEALKAVPDVFIGVWDHLAGQDPYGNMTGYVGRDGKKYEDLVFLRTWGDHRMRGFFSALTTVDIIERLVPVDYGAMRIIAAKLKQVMDRGKEIRVTSPAGTDVTFSIRGRNALVDDGNLTTPGKLANLPCGETFISPAIASTEGVVVFDGSITLEDRSVIPETPVSVTFRDGYVAGVTGGSVAKELMKVIRKGERVAKSRGLQVEATNARHIGEFGIGLNPAARVCDNLMEAEKAWKTVHFALGANFDNDAPALIHQDCLVLSPSVWVDDRQIMKDGDLLL